MTPRLLTREEEWTVELILMVKLLHVLSVDGVPIRRTSVLELLSLRKLEENHAFISCRWGEGG